MKELMIMYHPVKKEVRFLAKAKGEFVEIPYAMCPWLSQYAPDKGEFLLQNHGNKFFEDIWEQFLRDQVSITFKGTKIDYADFVKKVKEYNKNCGEERFIIEDFIELPSVAEIFQSVSEFCDTTLKMLGDELQNSDIKDSYIRRKAEFEEKKAKLNNSDVNLCLVGTYSSGKSTFINALIGRRILPESINSETAKMFRISNAPKPSVAFKIKKGGNPEHEILATITWDEVKKKFAFHSDEPCEFTEEKVNGEINSSIMFRLQQHEQLYQILKKLNDIPNLADADSEEFVDGIIDVYFPIPLGKNINFTFYDTPGTDSNSNEHLLVLQKALQQQTNSILIVLYEPTKMEGTGNSILYNLIGDSNDKKNDTKVTIDLTRSLHIINQSDTKSLEDLKELRNKKVEVTLKETDKIYNEEAEQIDLAKERLFFVSAKAAYIAKAIGNNVDTEEERRWLANHKGEINNEPIQDPFLRENAPKQEVETGMYFKLDKLANSENETKQLIKDCNAELKKCQNPEDTSLYPIVQRIYVNSGMYAIEKEIIRYAQKYALAVKAKGLYDGISSVVNFIREDYEVIENQARLSKEEIERNIDTMKNSMVRDIDAAYADYMQNITTESLVFQIDDINQLYTVIENRKIQAGKIADKMKWIAIRPEVFEEKNNIIRNELNRYLEEIDNSYKNNRGRILQQQIDELKGIIIQKITGYKGIDENLIRRITNVSETQIPPSSLKALKMDEYINKQKAIFIFSTNNKKNYKADVEQMFANTTKVQFDAYINEIMEVAKDKTAELIQEFKNNIDSISSSLELLIKDEKRASEEQLKAKNVLDLVDKMDDELNKKIWGEEEIKQAEDVILGKKDGKKEEDKDEKKEEKKDDE